MTCLLPFKALSSKEKHPATTDYMYSVDTESLNFLTCAEVMLFVHTEIWKIKMRQVLLML